MKNKFIAYERLWTIKNIPTSIDGRNIHQMLLFPFVFTEEVILSEDRTSEEEKRHIMNVRRRAAEKKRKLKQAGKSKSTDTEEESTYDYNKDEDGKSFCVFGWIDF